ncbi:hypothetical protein E4U55_002868 [Claviceps digitariae]|nr:hypothetical protein E4U55_002868 [Claviceps digitariae]
MRLLSFVALATLATAHVEMTYPAPFRSKYNNYSNSTDIDYSMTTPLDAGGINFPCKGYHALMNKPQGRSVATWQPGQTYTATLEGTATHQGGSCQFSLSYDEGVTWTVVQSYIGGCPLTPSWRFSVPADAPAGEALFAWTWFNRIGNREMYMNCAHVTIGYPQLPASRSIDPWDTRPKLFVANVGNRCSTAEGVDVQFPSPGPNVVMRSDKTADPVGDCR